MLFKRRQWLAVLFALSFSTLAIAIELPLRLNWDSANTSSYAPQQSEKEASWSEFYRIGIGIDSLSYKQARLSMLLQSRNDFVANKLELKELMLSYQLGRWELSAESMPIGYGLQNGLNPHHLVSASQDDYLYQESRFNGLELSYIGDRGIVYGKLGGNVHIQSISNLGYLWQNEAESLLLGLDLSARSMDAHWRSPLNISSASLAYKGAKLSMNLQTALSYYWDFNRTNAHTGFFAAAEARFFPFVIPDLNRNLLVDSCLRRNYSMDKSYLYLAAHTKELEPSRKSLLQYQVAWHQSLGKFSVNPALQLERRIGTNLYQAHLAGDYSFLAGQRIGLYYQAQGSTFKAVQHSIGLQAELSYGL